MFKAVKDQVWFYDCEWVPDPKAGRLVYDLPDSYSDEAVIAEMWKRAGATPENPYPPVKTNLCRIVSVSAVMRISFPELRVQSYEDSVKLRLLWLPRDINDSKSLQEGTIIGTFMNAVGKFKPQLLAYDLIDRQLKHLMQRALINDVIAKEFCERPKKPWEGVDYFAKESGYTIDLRGLFSYGSKSEAPSLSEMALLTGIPANHASSRGEVAQRWLNGDMNYVLQHNCRNALATYLLWLRAAHLSGYLNDDEYDTEEMLFTEALSEESEKPDMSFLADFLDNWN